MECDLKVEFGVRLRELRASSGATLSDVAEATGISIAMLSRMENGQRLPSSRFAEALARYFGVPADEFLADVVSDSVRSRYGMEPDEYAASFSADRDWAPARERLRAIREDLRQKASDLQGGPVLHSEAIPVGEMHSDLMRSDVMPGDDSIAKMAPPGPDQVRIRENIDHAQLVRSAPDPVASDSVDQADAVRRPPAYEQHPVAELFSSSARGPSDDAALAQRASLRHLRQMLHSGGPAAAIEALHAVADLAEDPLALLREAAAHPDPAVRDAARALLDRLTR